ncbi:glycosyltransferase family 4 protein [Desulfofundulus sp.]|uniref:glycosyltransferase family 4 protein n=1 Tax=Desulfofundulus sp. TaxID=2282750 RepID=UPI003C745CA5
MRVIYEFPGEFFSVRPKAADIEAFKREKRLSQYILYVGNRKPHKNLGRLLQAFARLKPSCPELQLVIVGKVFDQHDELASMIRSLRLQGVKEIKECNDEELRLLYYGARALVLPSLYEGFGLPPLEAMACGTPVVVSNTASLPEVVGDAGVYVNPYDVDDIAQGIYRVLTDQELRCQLREKGLARAKLFTWKRSARETLKVFEEVLEEKGNSRK